MALTKCPKCGAATTPAMGRSYCQECGWNREAAERRYVRVQWLLPVLILIFDFVGIVALGMERHDWPGAILFATLPTLLLGFVYAGVRQGLARMRSPLRAAVAGASDEAAALRQAAEAEASREKSEQYAFLLSMPPPRPVEVNRRGKRMLTLSLLFAFGMEAFLLWTLYGVAQRASMVPNSQGAEILLAFFMILMASWPLFVRRGIVRHQKLMENGAVAIGRITEQRDFKNASAIRYEFEDSAGHTVTGLGNDRTRSFSPGMSVPVFYDPQNPKRQIAVCCAYSEIVNPGGS